MFNTRNKLYRMAYQHKTSVIIERMYVLIIKLLIAYFDSIILFISHKHITARYKRQTNREGNKINQKKLQQTSNFRPNVV